MSRTEQGRLKYGVANLPFMTEKVQKGNTDLVPLISELVDAKLPPDATQQECLNWWNKNKSSWTISFGPIKRKATKKAG